MEYTSINIATININTITNTTKINALNTFARTADLDIIFLQEVENDRLTLAGYNVICNVDQTRRGTAIALKEHIKYSHVERSLDGRLIALRIHNTTLCNVYAPSGSVHRAARERFFNNTIAYYLRHQTDHIIMGGDFNCVIRQCDATGNNSSPALKATVQQLRLLDVWPLLRSRENGFTYISHNSSSRLDRLYVSTGLREQLRETAVHVSCFSDHKALTVRMCIPLPERAPGRGFWSLRPHVLTDENINEFQTRWQYWTRYRRNYQSWMEWWLYFAKAKIKSFFRWKSNAVFENFHREHQRLYTQLRQAYDEYHNNRAMLTTINRVKAQMLSHQRRFSEMFVRINETFVAGEPLSTYQLGERTRKRTIIDKVRNERDEIIDDNDEIRNHMVQYYKNLYAREEVAEEEDGEGVFQCERVIPENDATNEACMDEITTTEILSAIRTSSSRKSPGPDGLPKEFYMRLLDTIHRELNLIMNDAIRSNFPAEFTDGVIVLVKKQGPGDTARSYRPISLVNFDYKILSRIMKQRMENVLRAHSVLTNTQKCSNSGHNIFQATLALKDRIAQLKANRRNAKLVSFDLDSAFDRVDQNFLFHTMRSLGFNSGMVDLFARIAAASSSRLLINGHLSLPFPIQRSVRQGDPLSMHLFVLYLHPLLKRLEQVCGADLIVAYADDISAIITDGNKLNTMRNLFNDFGRISGARLNEFKTTAIDIGEQNALAIPWIRTENKIKILGVFFSNSIRNMTNLNWDSLVAKFGHQIWLHSMRSLSLHQKATLLNTFLLSRIWYIAANLAPTAAHVAKLTANMRNYLFRGMSATVPMPQLARRKEDGGINLHLPIFKCRALLLNSHLREHNVMPFYSSYLSRGNPTPANTTADLPCLKQILSNLAILPFQIRQHPTADAIYRLYVRGTDKPKVETANNNTNWKRVWRNIADRNLSPQQRSDLYMWVNQKMPHRRLLFIMRRTDGEQCIHCGIPIETLQHKFFECSRVRDAYGLLQQTLHALIGGQRTLQYADLLRPSLDRITTPTRRRILKILIEYIIFIEKCNGVIDVNELNFNLGVIV